MKKYTLDAAVSESYYQEMPDDWQEFLYKLGVSTDYEFLTSMGMEHDEAFHTAVAFASPQNENLH